MPWEVRGVVEQRLEFCRLAEAGGVSLAELCRRFGIKRDTGYKWLGRFRAEGEAGLVDRSRTPRSSPNRTAPGVEELVCRVRRRFPAWGGRKIRGFLLRQGHTTVPAASTITAILRRRGLINEPAKSRAYERFEREAPNDLWQMDFKGWFALNDTQRVHSFGMLDDHSRYNLCLAACSNQRTATVKDLLSVSFGTYGLPEAMLMDNGSPWGNNKGQPWTPLTVWLVDLGIWVIHSTPWHPQTAGKEERFHRTLDLEVISTRAGWETFDEVQDAYDSWRLIYNHHRPHDSLGETVVPADRYRPSARSMPTRITEPEYDTGTDIRKVAPNGRFSWNGHSLYAGKAFAGRHIAIRPTTTDSQYQILYRHHPIRNITLD